MKNFENQLTILKTIIFEEENFSKAESLLLEMIEADDSELGEGTFSEFLSLAADAIEDKEHSATYELVTKWALSQYNLKKSSSIMNAMKYADSMTSWLNHKLELVDNPAEFKESKIALSLFADIILHANETKPAAELTNDYQGYATYALMLGLSEGSHVLVDKAIDAQRMVLKLYQEAQFPQYYNMATFRARAKRDLASTLMDAYEFDSEYYLQYHQEIGELLREAVKDYKTCGTGFDKKYTSTILKKYKAM